MLNTNMNDFNVDNYILDSAIFLNSLIIGDRNIMESSL